MIVKASDEGAVTARLRERYPKAAIEVCVSTRESGKKEKLVKVTACDPGEYRHKNRNC